MNESSTSRCLMKEKDVLEARLQTTIRISELGTNITKRILALAIIPLATGLNQSSICPGPLLAREIMP
jgi:hypothetical protein